MAALGGTVYRVYKCTHINCNPGCLSDNCGGIDCDGFGTGVIIKGSDGRYYQYAHMVPGSIPSDIYAGASVAKGQTVGKVGNSGAAKGVHLHFQINITNPWHGSVDPPNETYDSFHVHDYWLQSSSQPNCTSDGYDKYVCSCGDSYKITLPALGHDYEKSYILPTMQTPGNVKYTCTRCGNSYLGEEIPAPQKKEDGWYYCDVVPSDISSDNFDIQYSNYYEKIQTDSPGSDWVQSGVVSNEWINTGDVYNSWYELPTSDSRVLTDSYYYHYCSATTGIYSNYESTSTYVHGDTLALDLVNIDATYLDGDIPYYSLSWKSNGTKAYCCSGVTCDSSYGTHGQRSYYWYKMNWYQDKYQVVKYLYTKTTGWVDYNDSTATSTTCRFKFKDFAPSNVTATAGDGKVTVKWDSVDNAEMYRVYNVSGSTYTRVYSGDGTLTSAEITGLTNGKTYSFAVTAKVNGEWSDYSEAVSATPFALKPTITGYKVGDYKVKLEWKALEGAEMYRVYTYRKGAYTRAFTCDGTRNVATVSGLNGGLKYGFVVSAKVNGAWTDYTNPADLVYAVPTGVTKPTIIGYKAGDFKVKLEWTPIPNASMYRVYTYENGVYKRQFTCDGSRTIATVTNLNGSKEYAFVVSVKVGDAWSDYSDVNDLIYITTTGTPKPVIIGYKVGDGKVKLEWTALDGAEMYRVYTYANGTYTRQFTCDGSRNVATVSNLTNGKQYAFTVSAKVNGVWTDYTDEAFFLYATPNA